jgi:DNA-binding response OmpR family regulator
MAMILLIVDDEDEVCQAVTRLFNAWGWACKMLTDGKAAHRAVRELRPDAVLLDLMMPEPDGFAILKAIRSDPDVAKTPVILYSALNEEHTLDRALAAGADDYILKGTPVTQIRERVALYISN